VAERGADESAVGGHLGHARREVVAVLVAILGQPRGDQLLGAGQRAGREHLGAQRVLLELLDVGLGEGGVLVSFSLLLGRGDERT